MITEKEFDNLNIGDIVLLKSKEECEEIMSNNFVSYYMGCWCGKEVTIKEFYTEITGKHKCFRTEECHESEPKNGYHFFFYMECIEKVIYSLRPSEITISTASLF